MLMYLLASRMGYYGLMLLTWPGLAGIYAFLWLLCRQESKSTPATAMVFTIAASISGLFVPTLLPWERGDAFSPTD